MAELLILEFSHPDGASMYEQVNKNLGVDQATGSGDWPAGLTDHRAGVDGNTIVVVETWESRSAQDDFMRTSGPPGSARSAAGPAPDRPADQRSVTGASGAILVSSRPRTT